MTVMSSATREPQVAMGRAVRPAYATTPRSPFKEVMANMAAPVAVVTAADDGVGSGATVSALMSLSMNPEMILVGLDRRSTTLEVIRRTGRFGVNILSVGQTELAMRFASKRADKFDGQAHWLESGVPRLAEVSGWVRCSVERIQPGGDHLLVSGLIEASFHDPMQQPMTYQGRSFGTHRAG